MKAMKTGFRSLPVLPVSRQPLRKEYPQKWPNQHPPLHRVHYESSIGQAPEDLPRRNNWPDLRILSRFFGLISQRTLQGFLTGVAKDVACSLRSQDIKKDVRPSYAGFSRAGPEVSFVLSSHYLKSHAARSWQIARFLLSYADRYQ
jgi:hypothetical protein